MLFDFIPFVLLSFNALSEGYIFVPSIPKLHRGYYKFFGKVECEGNQTVLHTAKVELWEWDDLSGNDLIRQAKIHSNGSYEISGYAEDTIYHWKFVNIELFLSFNDVCAPGDQYLAAAAFPKTFQTFRLLRN